MVVVIGAIMEVVITNKVATKEEAGILIKVTVEGAIQGEVITVVLIMHIRVGVANTKETQAAPTKTGVIIKGQKQVIQMNMTIEVKGDDNTADTRANIAGCKELVGRKDTKPLIFL